MLKTIFYLKAEKKNEQGESAIYCRITCFNSQTTLSTGKFIVKERWGKTNHLRNPLRIKSEKCLKNYLDSIIEKIENAFLKVQRNNNAPSAQLVKAHFLGRIETNDTVHFTSIVKLHNDYFANRVRKEERSKASLQKYIRASKLFSQFLKCRYQISDIKIDLIRMKMVYDFENYLKYESTFKNKVGICNNTTVKYMRRLSTIFSHAIKREVINHNPFKLYDGKIEEKETEFLTNDQLKILQNKVIKNYRLKKVRDIFLFSCYTGYAPVDIRKLKKTDLIKDNDGTLWIKLTRTKSKIKSNVPVLKPALEIIERYSDHDNESLIPTLSSQKMNAYLKEIADICGIEMHLTHYVARHTFATTVTLGNGVTIENVSSMMGHTNLQRTRHYAKILDANVKRDMDKLKDIYK